MTLFNRLSVFGGEFSLDVAEAVAGVDGIASEYVLEGLSHLVDKSLIQSIPNRATGPRTDCSTRCARTDGRVWPMPAGSKQPRITSSTLPWR